MAGWFRRLCALFSNKEVVTIILWYAACTSVTGSLLLYLNSKSTINIIIPVQSTFIIVLYLVLGLFGDVFIGRYRLIQFSLWVKFMTVIISSLIIVLLPEWHFHVLLQTLLYSFLFGMEQLGQTAFHIVAIQFGTDQLQGAPSDHLSAFIFWYIIAEILPIVMYGWVGYSLSFIKQARIDLFRILLSTVFVSVVLSVKNCFMSKWFVRETVISSANYASRDRRTDNSNPYHLIYCVLKFAKEHKSPIRRSALTYWEDDIPSRIDLGKRKYGGPFTTEEIEDVKTFFQLLKLLLSLSGLLTISYLIRITPFQSSSDSRSESYNLQDLINTICRTATTGLLILCHTFSKTCFHKYHLSMLKRIGIGAILTVICVLSVLIIDFKYVTETHENKKHILLYMNLVPMFLAQISYVVLLVSLFEFIIAQSPNSMKGILIGFCYIIHYGFAEIVFLIEYYAFHKLPCTSAINCSTTVSYIVIIVIAVLSFIVYCIVACKYKLRERDEVVNVHIFAEEYYGNREDDLDSDDDQDVSDSMIEESIT